MASFTNSSSTSSSSSDKGFIFIPPHNEILYEQLKQRLIDGRRDKNEVRLEFSELDGVSYLFHISPDTPNIANIHICIKGLENLKEQGSNDILQRYFPNLEITPENGYDYAIKIDCDNYSSSSVKEKEDLIDKVSHIKKYCECGPLEKSFTLLSKRSSASGTVVELRHRELESIYICPREEKVIIIISSFFIDPTERAFAKIFLQEFVESQRTIRNAPAANYVPNAAPKELDNVKNAQEEMKRADCAGFISFAVEPRHIAGEHMQVVLDLMLTFRNYLSYHIKCSKTYLHMRMRQRMSEWIQVLERAKPEVESEKKTMSGRTFSQRK